MGGAINTSDFKETSYLIVATGIVVDMGDAFRGTRIYLPRMLGI